MDNGSDRLKSVMFKRAAGGWIYRAPNKWVLGDAPHYFVTDEQKAKIEAIVVPRRPLLFGINGTQRPPTLATLRRYE